MKTKVSFRELKDEVAQIRNSIPQLKDDSAFVLWFLRAFLADTEDNARGALCGDTNDKGIDAILIDERAKQVNVIQGKFHHSLGEFSEKRNDVLSFVEVGLLPWQQKSILEAFYDNLDPFVRQKYEELVLRIKNNKYELRLYYVTTGRCSELICKEAERRAHQAQGSMSISIIDARQIITIFRDYIEGVAPAVPTLELRIADEGSIHAEGVIHRFDAEEEIESWVFSMSSKDVGDMYARTGIRLFARNVRGYLGQSNEINEAMAKTVRVEPHNFWYYNNGVTIVCDEARREIQGGIDVLRIEKPQVINGQQTTRTLSDTSSTKASVLVKVIKVTRSTGDDDAYDDLVSSIVRATNWQNAIRPSDLVSNDYIQVYIERELRKRGYQYLRKRQTKSEAKCAAAKLIYFKIKKDELAQAVAACEFDPSLVRKGKERLFEERYYRSIFGSRSVAFYLSRYWLMRQVQSVAVGYPERAYAKWLVLHLAWSMLSNDIGYGLSERRFRSVCEKRNELVLQNLKKALGGMFRASLAFFREERGQGEEAKDVSTFFMKTKLHIQFVSYWNSKKNSKRSATNLRLEKFRGALKSAELPE